MGQITFARMTGPPDSWAVLEVINLLTGTQVRDVIEVDTVERYLIRYRRDPRGQLIIKGAEPDRERITGDFEIRRVV